MASKVTIELNNTTELPAPQVEAWLDANDDGKLTASEKVRLTRSGGTWTGQHSSDRGQIIVRVLAPLDTRVKVTVADLADESKKRFKRSVRITRRPEWIVGEVKP